MREAIARLALPPELEAIALVSLMEAADRVDSTVGLQMAYLKQWAARAHNDLELRVPELRRRARAARCSSTRWPARERADEYDVAYLDPPYNQHKYMDNYHVWESLVRWDKPEVYGVACKRVDCRDYSSAFNSKARDQAGAGRASCAALRARYLIVSFNDEGYLSESRSARSAARARHGAGHQRRLQALRRRARSASTTRAGSRPARSRTCATASCCSWSTRAGRAGSICPALAGADRWQCARTGTTIRLMATGNRDPTVRRAPSASRG